MNHREATSKTVLSLFFLTLLLAAGSSRALADDGDGESPDGSWLSQAQGWIEASEYHFKFEGEDLSAPNRRHDLRSFVQPDGLRVESRTAGSDSYELSLIPRRWLRGDEALAIDPGQPFLDERRAELRRDGWTEWFVNLEDGLKHGMTLDRPPLEGEGRLTLSIELGPQMQAYANDDGTVVEFKHPGGASLRYADLIVFDALDRALPARMVVDRLELRIEIDDRDAVYPVTIDPLLTTVARSYQSNQGGAWMGYSVSTAGDVNGDGYSDVIIGAPLYDAGQVDEGRVFVFHGSSSGLNASSSWTTESNIQGAQLGLAASTAGDVNNDGYHDVVVATYRFTNGQSWEGKAWVYLGSSSGLQSGAVWSHESNRTFGKFGYSVSAAGDVNNDGFDDIVIGEPGYSVSVSDGGAVHLFLGKDGGINGSETTFAGPISTGQSGWDVSAAGDLNADGYEDFLSGAPFSESGQNDEGLVHVYFGAASTGSITTTTLQQNQNFARFGISVANAGDINGDGRADVLVGAEFWDNGATLNTGGAFVYLGTSGGISSTPAHTYVGQVNSLYGQTVSTAGDVNGDGYADVMIGAPNHDNGNTDEGLVVVYLGGASGLGGLHWSAQGSQDGVNYGAAIATAGDVNGDGYSDVMVGAYRYDDGSVDEGKVFVYHGSPGELQTSAGWSAGSGQAYANLGFSVSTAGDVNWDGFSDVIVGAPNYDAGQTNEGRAYVFLGSASGLSSSPNTTLEENQASASFGWAVSDAGDVNGDGYDDVFVGAPYWDAGQTDEGRVFLYLGSSSGVGAASSWTGESNDPFAHFGYSISRAGDINADGFGDLLVGAYAYGGAVSGAAFVYHGGTTLAGSPDWSYLSPVNGWLGYSVSGGGDINRDGFSDIIVGAPYYNASTDGGHVLIFRGSAGGLGSSPDQTFKGNQPNAEYGYSVANAGDLNRDGYSDLLVGSPLYEIDQTDEGVVFAYEGAAAGANFFTFLESNLAGNCFGCSVAGAGDVNGDGYDDALIGSHEASPGGRVTLWHGSASGLGSTYAWSRFGTLNGDEFGRSMDGAGDVNGDGFADVIVGSPGYYFNSGIDFEGRAFLYYGGGGKGLNNERRQSGGVATTPAALLGRSDDDNSFRVRYRARSAAGRSRVRMHVKVYDSTDNSLAGETLTEVVRTAGAGTGGSAYNFWRQVLNLQDGPHYRWIVRSIGRNPYFPRTPWRWMAGNGQREKDIGTTCIPVNWYLDSDGDGYGDAAASVANCTPLAGYVADNTDCDDGNGAINPGSAEIFCDGIDQNCNFSADDAPDVDGDGIDICDTGDSNNPDGVGVDNCPNTANPSQQDLDGDGPGDACDVCPNDALDDIDADGVCGDLDNCPITGNPTQIDSDADGIGDMCDICALVSDPEQEDGDGDGTGDACDNCPVESNPAQIDGDTDTFGDVCDCAPADGTTWDIAGPVVNLTMDNSGGTTTLTWDPPSDPGAQVGALVYDVLASFDATDFVGLALCLSVNQSATSYVDTLNPGVGQMFSYLVRAQNGCGEGSAGLDDAGQERDARTCN